MRLGEGRAPGLFPQSPPLCCWPQGPAHQPGRGATVPAAQQHGQQADHLALHPRLLHFPVLPEVQPSSWGVFLPPHPHCWSFPLPPSSHSDPVRAQERLLCPSHLHPGESPSSCARPLRSLWPCRVSESQESWSCGIGATGLLRSGRAYPRQGEVGRGL